MGVSLLLKIWTWRSCCICRSISAPQWSYSVAVWQTNMIVWTFNLFFFLLCVFLPSPLKCSRNITKCKKLRFEEAIKTEDS
jgi:hypothetical protein